MIDDVTRDAEEDDRSTLKRDVVFAKLNFTLDSGSFKILGTQTEAQTGITLDLRSENNHFCIVILGNPKWISFSNCHHL